MAVSQMSELRSARTAIKQMILDSFDSVRRELAVQVRRETTSQIISPTSHVLYSLPCSRSRQHASGVRSQESAYGAQRSRLRGLSRASSSRSARFNREATVPGEHSSTDAISW